MTVTASCEANMSSKHWIKHYKKKNELWKTRIEISFSPLQVCPSVLLFVFAVLFRTSFHILTGFICFTLFSGSSPFNLVSQFLWQIKHKATGTSFLRRTLFDKVLFNVKVCHSSQRNTTMWKQRRCSLKNWNWTSPKGRPIWQTSVVRVRINSTSTKKLSLNAFSGLSFSSSAFFTPLSTVLGDIIPLWFNVLVYPPKTL